MNSATKKLVIFDVDDTLIHGQSQRIFVKYLRDKAVISPFVYIKMMLWFVFYKLKLVKNPQAAVEYAYSRFTGWKIADVEKLVDEFFTSTLIHSFYDDSLELVASHRERGDEILIMSNAVDILVKRIARYLEITHTMSTILEVKDGVVTGKISGKMMYGQQKALAIGEYAAKNHHNLIEADAYADHESDIELLSAVGHPHAVNPTGILHKEALRRGWDVIECKG